MMNQPPAHPDGAAGGRPDGGAGGTGGRHGAGGYPGLGGSGGATSAQCDMTGVWIEAEVAFAEALSAQQTTVNWIYYDIVQHGDRFIAQKSLNCGLKVSGTTTVTLRDDAMEALALKNSSSLGRQGTFKLSADGQSCDFAIDRTYNLRGATKDRFLTDWWVMGDPALDLAKFPMLPKEPANGMEDWDNDGNPGITLVTSFGERYVSQRDWNEEHGSAPLSAKIFGGMGKVITTWDGQEAVSDCTSLFLRETSTPVNPGYSLWAKVDGELTVVTTGAHPELETCKNVQRLASMKFPGL
jgi:hypothetical protein